MGKLGHGCLAEVESRCKAGRRTSALAVGARQGDEQNCVEKKTEEVAAIRSNLGSTMGLFVVVMNTACEI
jgi:hypothetical protein